MIKKMKKYPKPYLTLCRITSKKEVCCIVRHYFIKINTPYASVQTDHKVDSEIYSKKITPYCFKKELGEMILKQ